MSVAVIKQQLLNKLNAMGELKAVFDFETSNPDVKYPIATLTIKDGDGRFASSAHNLRRQGFWIRVYQEQAKNPPGQGVQNAESIAVSVLDELQTALDMDTTLSGSCKYADVSSFNATYVDREMDTRVLEIQVDAWELVASQ